MPSRLITLIARLWRRAPSPETSTTPPVRPSEPPTPWIGCLVSR